MSEPFDWIVISGQLIDTTMGGGFEFHGPFTEAEAREVRLALVNTANEDHTCVALQLLGAWRRRFDAR